MKQSLKKHRDSLRRGDGRIITSYTEAKIMNNVLATSLLIKQKLTLKYITTVIV